jgi:HNH endonuclease
MTEATLEWLEGIEFLPVPRTSATFAARVFAKIDASGDCWEWTAAKDKAGYGVMGRGSQAAGKIQAHRAVWELLVGSIPAGMEYDHLCRNRGCVNPDHGEIVTPEENKRRGFGSAVLYSIRETCEFGHALDGHRRNGDRTVRYCKTCARERQNARHVPKPPRTRCKNGHDLTPGTTYIRKSGARICKICRAARSRRYRASVRGHLSEAA